MSAARTPELWIVAGPNGAGKTTCVQKEPIASLIPGVKFLNPDDRTLQKLLARGYQGFADSPSELQSHLFIESANEISSELDEAIARAEAVGIETVLSSGKYQSPVEAVRLAGGFVGLIYISLNSPAIARDRVAARVRRGGHGVPDVKIEERWHRSLQCLAWFAKRASVFWVIDNSDSDPNNPPPLLASGKSGTLEFVSESVFAELRAALDQI